MADRTKGDYFEILTECYKFLSDEAKDFFIPSKVPIICGIPKPMKFYKDYVSTNNPVIIQNAINYWPAVKRWRPQYLRNLMGNKTISVAVTPDGYADAVVNKYFMMPEERRIHFSHFLDILEMREKYNGIFYIQKQNSNMTSEFSDLLADIETDLPWATEAFDKVPDAINFWMGDERSVTSLHKDHYENIYCVLNGEKCFTLYPPTDLPFIPYEKFKAAVYKENDSGHFEIETLDKPKVSWIPVDPLQLNLEKYPQFANSHPIECTVKSGEILYLPSLWFHHVQQSHGCIAVNFWYDMDFDLKYVYYKFLEKLITTQVPR